MNMLLISFFQYVIFVQLLWNCLLFSLQKFFVLYKTLFLAVHPMCYVHILHSNTNSWLHTQQVTWWVVGNNPIFIEIKFYKQSTWIWVACREHFLVSFFFSNVVSLSACLHSKDNILLHNLTRSKHSLPHKYPVDFTFTVLFIFSLNWTNSLMCGIWRWSWIGNWKSAQFLATWRRYPLVNGVWPLTCIH
jgi:hypothetical protein